MKTTTPQITVKPDSTKTKKNGEAPIYVYCSWRGRAKMATRIYCNPKDWSEKTMTIKNKPTESKKLRDLVAQIEENISSLEGEFTAKDCLELGGKKKGLSYLALLSEMAQRRGLSESGVKKYIVSWNAYNKTTSTPFDELTISDWKGIAKTWKAQGKNLTTIWTRLTCFRAILNYAIETGRLKDNPLNNWRFKKEGYKAQTNPRALTNIEVGMLWDWYIKTAEIGGLFWFASYFFNGLALCDILKVDWEKVNYKLVDGKIIVSGGQINRSKTNQPVPLLTPIKTEVEVVLGVLKAYNGEMKRRSVNNWSGMINRSLKKSPLPNLTFYSARHTFCTRLVNSNIPLTDIATLLGRSIEGISVYIRQLQSESHLAEVLRKSMD